MSKFTEAARPIVAKAIDDSQMSWTPAEEDRVMAELDQLHHNTSDGYHTFAELYDHRMALTAALMKALPLDMTWRSKAHHPDGEPMFEGFFIVGIDLPTGTITYHYKLEHWALFSHVGILPHAPLWDGHTPDDVVRRLKHWVAG